MTSRERVRAAITFAGPDRVPVSLPGEWGNDILRVRFDSDPGFNPGREGEDEWGCVWQKVSASDKTKGQVRGHPLTDFTQLSSMRTPDYKCPARNKQMTSDIQANNLSENPKFVIANNPASLCHLPEYLRGTINAWTDPFENPEDYRKLLDIITRTGDDAVDRCAETGGVDAIILYDDWGLQDRPIFSPDLFDEFIKPMYARLFKRAHDHGLFTVLHSCGHITALLDSMIEAGLDVIQMDQQENMGMDNLARSFGGRIAFWCPVDIQKTMIDGTVRDVEEYARKLIDNFGRFNGGFIADWYAAPDAVGHSWEKINAMCRAFTGHGGAGVLR